MSDILNARTHHWPQWNIQYITDKSKMTGIWTAVQIGIPVQSWYVTMSEALERTAELVLCVV